MRLCKWPPAFRRSGSPRTLLVKFDTFVVVQKCSKSATARSAAGMISHEFNSAFCPKWGVWIMSITYSTLSIFRSHSGSIRRCTRSCTAINVWRCRTCLAPVLARTLARQGPGQNSIGKPTVADDIDWRRCPLVAILAST